MICEKCGWWDRICHCRELELFNTPKDKLFEFVEDFQGKSIEIRSKGQWKKFMKQHGLHDDIKQSHRKESDYVKNNYRPVPRKEIADGIRKELHDRGLYHKLVKRR